MVRCSKMLMKKKTVKIQIQVTGEREKKNQLTLTSKYRNQIQTHQSNQETNIIHNHTTIGCH